MITHEINKYKEKSWPSQQLNAWPHHRPEHQPHNHRNYIPGISRAEIRAANELNERDRPIIMLPGAGGGYNACSMTKGAYALFVNALPYKRGDFVVHRSCMRPYHARSVYQIKEIDQLHRNVDWGNDSTGPMILELFHYIEGHANAWKSGTKLYDKVDAKEVPQEWRDWEMKNPSKRLFSVN